ncbi:hypothetical protein EI94DRAFT_1706637 [Lactarius quietus]|nr:hypothetical protein EI94DRAFT_1706637 [Lactarius quietus]
MAVNLLVLQPVSEPLVVSVIAKEPGPYSEGSRKPSRGWFLEIIKQRYYAHHNLQIGGGGPPIAILLGKHDSEVGRVKRALVLVTDAPLSIGRSSVSGCKGTSSATCSSETRRRTESLLVFRNGVAGAVGV